MGTGRADCRPLGEDVLRRFVGGVGLGTWIVAHETPAGADPLGPEAAIVFTLSPLVGRQCRFQPTCSNYFIGSVAKHGAVRGAWRGVLRVLRCHPWHPGGYDPP